MRTWVRRSLQTGALTAGALLVAGSTAQAAPTMTSTGNTGALSGTQALLPIQAPIDVCGNAVAAAGAAFAGCEGGATALDREWTYEHYRSGSGPTMTSAGNTGIGNGTQVFAPVQVPVNACGNAIAVLGSAAASCQGGAKAEHGKPEYGKKEQPGYGKKEPKQPGYGKKEPEQPGYGKKEPKQQPKPVKYQEATGATPGDPAVVGGTTMVSSGNVGILNGTQVFAPIQVPINICGNAIGILGTAQAQCEGGATAIQRS